VSDIFHEVDEEVRREQLRKLWERYSALIVALAVLIVLGVAGWRGYEWWQAKQAAAAGAAFEQAALLAEQGKHQEAETAFAKIAADSPASYRVLAKLRETAELAQRDPNAAITAYKALAGDLNIGPVQRDFAAVRAGQLMVDQSPYGEVKTLLEPLTAADRPFRNSARALLALSAWHGNDVAATKQWANMVLADNDAPVSTRGQMEMLITLSAEAGKS
jgi:hypothetical protein